MKRNNTKSLMPYFFYLRSRDDITDRYQREREGFLCEKSRERE